MLKICLFNSLSLSLSQVPCGCWDYMAIEREHTSASVGHPGKRELRALAATSSAAGQELPGPRRSMLPGDRAHEQTGERITSGQKRVSFFLPLGLY